MNKIKVNTNQLKELAKTLKAGDEILLSGVAYTARDAAHQRLIELIKNNKELPFELSGATVYYAGPTEAPKGRPIGSCGPTTSCRMDSFTPTLLKKGLCCMIGKGNRSQEVIKAMVENQSVYFCAVGGAGALASKSIISSEVIGFEDLGPESIKKLLFKDFPLYVGIDSKGNTIFK